MTEGRKVVEVDLPEQDANEMTARAAMEGIDPARFIGVQALKGFKGALHPEVIAFHKRADQGQPGTEPGED
ncbi:hypothetical protein ACQUFY_20960 [Robbsia andropogonis]|uniref:hypothetical protein n=1 Tax=Robbsia andropogonis TaxID=28092 RepID=UPI00209F0426|nr:hypothetical protein [Robbsia andropogonis]MCP1121593.1 hypothetical protein [Robbsia andropogonis]MCP1131400.1 hypothetical protein [Robbsia andropogonis]